MSLFNDATVVAWNLHRWEYLHCWNQETLQTWAFPRPLGAGYIIFSNKPQITGVSKAVCKTSHGVSDHTGLHLVPAKAHSHFSYKALMSNQETVECGGPLQKEEMGKHLFIFSTHIRNRMRTRTQINSILPGYDSSPHSQFTHYLTMSSTSY